MNNLNPMPNNPQSWINTLWESLDYARELYADDQWDEITIAMAWNTEALECHDPMDDRIKNCTEPTCSH